MSRNETLSTEGETSIFFSYFSFFCDIGMILLPSIGYIAQLVKILQLKTSNGFSKKIPFFLLVSNILRIFFWIGKNFSLILLLSSIVMLVMQSLLLYYCVKYTKKSEKDIKVNYFDLTIFWEWPHIFDYFYLFTFFIVILTIISNTIGFDNDFFIETLGILSALFEALIGIPQIIVNYKNKAIISLSYFLILTWFLGDISKTIYYSLNSAPYQILISGIFQLFTDIIILSQISYYKQNNALSIE